MLTEPFSANIASSQQSVLKLFSFQQQRKKHRDFWVPLGCLITWRIDVALWPFPGVPPFLPLPEEVQRSLWCSTAARVWKWQFRNTVASHRLIFSPRSESWWCRKRGAMFTTTGSSRVLSPLLPQNSLAYNFQMLRGETALQSSCCAVVMHQWAIMVLTQS